MTRKTVKFWLILTLLFLPPHALSKVKIERVAFEGWRDAIRIISGEAEVVIVPSVGRVMQFSLRGTRGVFWINEKLAGKSFAPATKEWLNFGGDKVWAAPIADWRKMLGRSPAEPSFPPAPGFDGLPHEARIRRGAVEMISPADAFYGIRVRRLIKLEGARLTIKTTFEKLAGEPVKVSIWTVTQLRDPQKVFLFLPEKSRFDGGFTKLSAEILPGIERRGQILQLDRDRQKPFKIGSDALRMLWVGDEATLEMSAPREKNALYPDDGSSVEIYTAPDPLGYVEFETLGKLETLRPGEKASLTTSYVLRQRNAPDAAGEAVRLWLEK